MKKFYFAALAAMMFCLNINAEELGEGEILPGKTLADLKNADHWYYNEYRGGRNAEAYPHWDWSCDFMATMDFYGWWEEQNEGTTLQIRNREEDGDWDRPADTENFESYVYGMKHITEDNKIMTIQCRTHATDSDNPAYWGVDIIDLSQENPVAEKYYPDNLTLDRTDGSYSSEEFDLSDWVGKDVIIAIGLYRVEQGDYWKQLVLRRIAFNTNTVPEGNWDWLEGTPIAGCESWALTQEMVRSTMPQVAYSFTGVSPDGGNRDDYGNAYHNWRNVNHIGYCWSFVPLHKDTEPFASEGFVMKTNGGGTAVSTTEPQAYFYAKFDVSKAHDKFNLVARNFSSNNATYCKFTAITNDMKVENIIPTTNATQFGEADNGCFWFMHEDGGADNPEGYATFTFDLSKYDGQEVTLVLGVYKGTDNGDENKICIYSASLDGEEDAIATVNAQSESNAIYTLGGVKVAKASQPGLYIQNGKKIVIK